MLPQQYCLRWKYHHSNLQTMFSQLLDRGCFCDVTLACEGQTLKAHRVVLSACSTYFDSILTNCNSEKDPIIILKDVKFMDIKYLVEFMYKGEINVEHNNLASLLKTAEELRIKGLAEVSWRDDDSENPENNDSNNNVTDTNNFPVLSQTPVLSNGSLSSLNNGDSRKYDNKENLLKSIPFLAPLSSPKDLSSGSRKKRGRPPLDETNHFTRAPKYVHLTNEQFYEPEAVDGKDGIYDLSTTASSSTTNTLTTSHTALHRHIQDEGKNHSETSENLHNGGASTSKKPLKHSPLPHHHHHHHYTNTSNLVTVMMDEKSHDNEEHSFYMPLRRDNEQQQVEYDEDPSSQNVIPKVERADTPNDLAEEEDENISCSPAEHLQSIFLTDEERKQWNDVIRMNDYLTKGRRPQFWEEPFTKRVLDAIKNKNLEMKKAAKLLGVSYGTLYGRYRETYGCLKHPYRGPPGSYMVSRMREMWPGNTDEQNDLLNLVQRNRISMMQNDDVNGSNIMDMMHDEAMLEQLAAAKNFPRKMINNLDVANLLKQVQTGAAQHQHQQQMKMSQSPSSSSHSVSPRSASPSIIQTTAQHMMLTPVATSNTAVDPSK
ncbi:CLUMA_CG004602, isoform A [Clunio marinus]|uniref:CLUMA_CG004602, isoform A n=1 Tax=Clunio marinus TaxID=568069 RepID=A0A1J1HXN7_9DIPT|nr:CLUMA_CG004602, isoform A [Clunio marinus]